MSDVLFGKAEVRELHHELGTVRRDEDVLRFDITVEYDVIVLLLVNKQLLIDEMPNFMRRLTDEQWNARGDESLQTQEIGKCLVH